MGNVGVVYVLVNQSFPGMVKVGRTDRDAESRAKELSSATGVPTPFIVVYQENFTDCIQAEMFVHTYLANKGCRVRANREFFESSPKLAIEALIKAKSVDYGIADPQVIPYQTDDPNKPEDELFLNSLEIDETNEWEDFQSRGDDHYYGFDDNLQDYVEAMKEYQTAYRLGSPYSCYIIATMYMLGEGVREDNKTALEFLKEGIRRGDDRCYSLMADLFNQEDHQENSLKCWDKFFNSSGFINGKLYNSCFTIGYVLRGYILQMKKANIEITNVYQLCEHKKNILDSTTHLIESAKKHGHPLLNLYIEQHELIEKLLSF